jgi:hypothetical protein
VNLSQLGKFRRFRHFHRKFESPTISYRMSWLLIRTGLLIAVLATAFNFGRLSIVFSGTGSDWAMLISCIVTLICSLIGLAAGELARAQPKRN